MSIGSIGSRATDEQGKKRGMSSRSLDSSLDFGNLQIESAGDS